MFGVTKKIKNVSVVGTGIVGLTTALMLQEVGHQVKIYEKNSSFANGTVNISLTKN